MSDENLYINSGALGPGPNPSRPRASASQSTSGTATTFSSSPASAPAPAPAPAPAQAPAAPREPPTPHPHVFRVAENRKMRLEQDRLKRQAELEAANPLDLSQLADELGPYCDLSIDPPASVTSSSSSSLCPSPPPFARIPPELRAPPNQELIYECQYPPAHRQPSARNPTPWYARFPVAGLPFTSPYYIEEDGDDHQDQDQDQDQDQNQEQDPFKDFAEIASASGPLPAATATARNSQRRSPTADIYFENRRLARINGAIFIHSPFTPLYPLMDPSNGKQCIWFPETIPELNKTEINAINQMLCSVWRGFDLNADRATKIDWIAHQWVQFTQ